MTLPAWWHRAVHRAGGPLERLRTPVLPQLSRGWAHCAVVLLGVLTMLLGAGSAALVRPDPGPSSVAQTAVGPLNIHLPDDVGPWTVVPSDSLERLRSSDALGGAEVEQAWGAIAPGTVVLTVLTAAPRSPGAAVGALATITGEGDASWSGRAPHVVGVQEANGVRELILAVAVSDDLLVIASLSGPVTAFASGTLNEAFRTASVDVDGVSGSAASPRS